MYQAFARPPSSFASEEIDEFVALVLAGGEVVADGLRDRVLNAECIAFLRDGTYLVGTAGLKRPTKTYRTRVQTNSSVHLSKAAFPFELGWVFVLPRARGQKLSFPLCQAAVSAAGSAGVFATSRSQNPGMHATLRRLGFERVGAPWASERNDDSLVLFTRPAIQPDGCANAFRHDRP